MTLQDAINTIAELKPHQYTNARIVKWLSDLDQKIFYEYIDGHYNYDDDGEVTDDVTVPDAYDADELTTVLLVADPYSELYIPYLKAMIDENDGDYNRYNNDMVLYNTKLEEFVAYYNRTHLPKQPNYINPFGPYASGATSEDPFS